MNQWLNQAIDLLKNGLDIIVVWIVIYTLLKAFQNNAKTLQIIKGIVYVIIAKIVADFLDLKSMNLILNFILNWGVLAVIVIFQPEIRSLLEKLGQGSSESLFKLTVSQKEKLLQQLIPALEKLSAQRIGALITIQRHDSVMEHISTSTTLNSAISSELLTSIFVPTTPLHDGAVIISGDTILCAAAFLPTTTTEIPTRFGSRHRAGVAISEATDSITIIVSEETGLISVAERGKLTLFESQKELITYLESALPVGEESEIKQNTLPFWRKNGSASTTQSEEAMQSMTDVWKKRKQTQTITKTKEQSDEQ